MGYFPTPSVTWEHCAIFLDDRRDGINEMIRNFTSDADDITIERGRDLALRFLDPVRARIMQSAIIAMDQPETTFSATKNANPAKSGPV